MGLVRFLCTGLHLFGGITLHWRLMALALSIAWLFSVSEISWLRKAESVGSSCMRIEINYFNVVSSLLYQMILGSDTQTSGLSSRRSNMIDIWQIPYIHQTVRNLILAQPSQFINFQIPHPGPCPSLSHHSQNPFYTTCQPTTTFRYLMENVETESTQNKTIHKTA